MTDTHCYYNPQTGWTIDSIIPETGVSRYSKLSEPEFMAEHPEAIKMTLEEAYEASCNRFISPPERITEERFDDMLNVLPPMKWVRNIDTESFMMCEYTIGNVTGIYARVGEEYWTLTDKDTLKHHEIIQKITQSQELSALPT